MITSTVACNSQKKYQVGKTTWRFDKPASYGYRVDNFSDAVQHGDSYIKEQAKDIRLRDEEVVLVSVAKNDSSDVNSIRANYETNTNITRFTLKGYVEQLAAYFKQTYEEMGSKVESSISESTIDGIKFYVIESTVSHTESGYKYGTLTYISEIDSKEFGIVATYDNDEDKKLILKSISSSSFN